MSSEMPGGSEMRRETEMEMASRLAREAVAREIAELDRRAEVTPARRVRRTTAPSIVYSIRLDPAEVELLEAQADERGLKPTVLARNLIRSGLYARRGDILIAAVERLEQVVDEVRSLIPTRKAGSW